MKKNSVWFVAAAILAASLAACTSETADPEQTDEAAQEKTENTEKTSSELAFCSGPRPICAWPEVAQCTCSTWTTCRWRCP